MWVIEDYRDAPMVPIALFPSEKLARAFAESACGDNAYVYEKDVHLDNPRLAASESDNDNDDGVRDELGVMLHRMRERPPVRIESTPRLRAAGAR